MREYWAEITRLILRPLDELIRERVIPELDGLTALARAELGLDAARHDVIDLAEAMIERLESDLFERVPESALRELAFRRGMQISDLSRRYLGRELKRVVGLDVFAEDPAFDRKLNTFAAENVRLIKKMTREHMTRIGGIVTNGLVQGRSTSALRKQIEQAAGIPKRRAQLIARDQIASLNSQITRSRQQANGITHFTWRTVGDERVRDEHEDIDGQRFTWASGHPTEGFPGGPINCRCTAEPVLE
jgi:SPP1 gp7 family putative phage head morphogenesis protein